MTQDRVIGTWILQGGVDQTLIARFLDKTLDYANVLAAGRDSSSGHNVDELDGGGGGRIPPDDNPLRGRGGGVYLFMDNATIHKGAFVKRTIRSKGVHTLFNCAYSPHLNPIEHLFGLVKHRV